jgi:serine/threonine kinase PknH
MKGTAVFSAAAIVVVGVGLVGCGSENKPSAKSSSSATSEVNRPENPTGSSAPTTSQPAGNLTPADLDLLKVMPEVGYNSENCTHQNPTQGSTAELLCKKNAVTGDPAGRFMYFPNTDAMTKAYNSLTSALRTTNCPGDPAGTDGAWSVNGKEIGRQACYEDKTVTPPAPSTIITNYNPPVMEIINWTDPSGMDGLQYWWRHGGPSVQGLPGKDPDKFTQDDLNVLNELNANEYSKTNCRHDEPTTPAIALLLCTHNLTSGAPNASFISYRDREGIQSWYDAVTKQIAPHKCAGGTGGGTDDAWFRNGKRVGRYTCVTEQNNVPGLVAVSTESTFLGAEFVAEASDSPYPLPKDEAALADWFRKRFTS